MEEKPYKHSKTYKKLREEFNNLRHIIFGFRNEVEKEAPALSLAEVKKAIRETEKKVQEIFFASGDEIPADAQEKIKRWFEDIGEKLQNKSRDQKKFSQMIVENLKKTEEAYQRIRKEIFR